MFAGVVARGGAVLRAESRYLHDPAHARPPRRREQGHGPGHVQRFERLQAALTQDTDGIHDDVDPRQQLDQRVFGRQRRVVEPRDACAGQPERPSVPARADHRVPRDDAGGGESRPDESARTRDEDDH